MSAHEPPIALLLIEDNAGDALMVQSALEYAAAGQHHIARATSLGAALATLGESRFDAILLDLSLPDSLGAATLDSVRAGAARVPIVVLTGVDDEGVAMEAVRRGADDYLVKGAANGRTIARAVRYAIDRRRAQEQLRQSEERYRHLMEVLPAAIYTCDRDGRITLYNQQAVALWGRQPALEQERWFGSDRLFHPDGRLLPRDQCPMARTIREGRAILGEEIVVERPDGSRVHVMPYPQPIYGPAGEVLGGVNVLVDITTLRRTQEDLRRLNESLEQRVAQRTAEAERRAAQLRQLASELTLAEQRERKRLARVLHDDLQQLLVAAKFRVSALEGAKDKAVRAAALLVSDLISQSIDSSRTLTGELFPPILHDGGLNPALHWLARWMGDKHALKVTVDDHDGAEPEGESVKVLLFQAVRELLFNVVKHAGVRQAQVRVCRVEDLIHVTGEDQGAGFDLRKLNAGRGGFGLRSVRERLDLLGGRMEIHSELGRGSRFTLIAPHQRSVCPEAPAAPHAVPGDSSGPAATGTDVARLRLLIADDHAVMRQGLNELFKNESDLCVVGEACDAQTAIHLARELRPDVVIMDVGIPGVGGIEATRLIRAELPDVKVIGLSMYEESDRAATMRAAGAAAYCNKSGPAGDLIAAIRGCAARCPSQQPKPGTRAAAKPGKSRARPRSRKPHKGDKAS
jgi:PAS domain S-box-containing protein